MLRIDLIASLFAIVRQKQASIIPKSMRNSNCVGILSDQGEAKTASNLTKYTIHPV